MKLTWTLNIIMVLLRILYRRHLSMMYGIIWAVCEIRTYFTFVSNYFLAFRVLVGKVVWLTQSRMVRYIRQALWHLNISHKGRNETTIHLFVMMLWPFILQNVAKCRSVSHQLHFNHPHSHTSMNWTECCIQAEHDVFWQLTWFMARILTEIYSYYTLLYICSNGSTLREFESYCR
jgi:hypothetical protein